MYWIYPDKWDISTIYSKQGREVQLSSRKLAIGRKIWIYHVKELEKLLVAKLFNFRSRFFLLLNLAFSKKSRKIVVLGGLIGTILIAQLLEKFGSLVQLVRHLLPNHEVDGSNPHCDNFLNLA